MNPTDSIFAGHLPPEPSAEEIRGALRIGPEDPWLSPQDLADLFGVPLRTVYEWNTGVGGPARYRIGGRVRYRTSDVEAWVAGRRVSA